MVFLKNSLDGLLNKSPRFYTALIVLISFASVGIALISQHVYGMEPCAWCVFQRLIFILIGIIGFAFLWVKNIKISQLGLGVLGLFSIIGMVAAIYQITVASDSFNCNLSIAESVISFFNLSELFPNVFGIYALCSGSIAKLFGVDYPIYSLFVFSLLSDLSVVGWIKLKKLQS